MKTGQTLRLGWIYTAVSGIAFLICIFMHTSDSISYWILPMAFTINLIVCHRYDRYAKNISILIIDILMVIRYAVLPISYYVSGQIPEAYHSEYEFLSIVLMIYEMVAVTLLIDIMAPKVFREDSAKENSYQKRDVLYCGFGIGTCIIVALFLMILAIHPQYLKNLITFRFEEFGAVEVNSDVNGMYNLIYKTGIIALACWILSRFRETGNRDTLSFAVCLLFSWLAMWMASVGTSGLVSRTSFLTNGIIFTLIVMRNFPSRKRIVVTCSITVITLMLLLGTAARFYSSDITSMMGEVISYEVLDSYFGGLRDVTVGLKMRDAFCNHISWSTLFTDIFAGVPYFASRSGMNFFDRTSVYYNITFFNFSGNVSRICPMIAQGATYFPLMLAPIFSCLSVFLALRFNRALKKSGSNLEYYFNALALYYFSAYAMYNIPIIMGGVWNKLLPVFLVLILDRVDLKRGVWRRF